MSNYFEYNGRPFDQEPHDGRGPAELMQRTLRIYHEEGYMDSMVILQLLMDEQAPQFYDSRYFFLLRPNTIGGELAQGLYLHPDGNLYILRPIGLDLARRSYPIINVDSGSEQWGDLSGWSKSEFGDGITINLSFRDNPLVLNKVNIPEIGYKLYAQVNGFEQSTVMINTHSTPEQGRFRRLMGFYIFRGQLTALILDELPPQIEVSID